MQHLALRIYKGTHGAPPDERPLVSVGAVPDTFSPVVPSLVDEPETWVLVHRYDYTLYVYQVTQEDTTYRQICLLVPVGIRLSADNNPYGLLLELWGILESQGNQRALFEERLALSIIGNQVSDMRFPVMDGQQPASFCADSRMQVKALLMFSQYPQLARVSRLEIGLHCASTIFLPIKANIKKTVSSEPVSQPKPDKPQVTPSVSEETKGEQTGKRRNMGKKVALYTFLLVAAATVIGFVFSEIEDSSGTSNFVLSTDTITTEGKTLVAEEKSNIPIEAIAPADNEMADSVPFKSGMQIHFVSQEKERERARAREEILRLVNKRDFYGCRHHPGWWEFLSNEERRSIEMIDEINDTSSTVVRKKFKRLLDKRFPLHSFDEIIKVGKEIINIKSEESIKKKGKKYTFKF